MDWKVTWMSRVNGQVEVDRGRMVLELLARAWSMQQKCGGQDDVVHAGSWYCHR